MLRSLRSRLLAAFLLPALLFLLLAGVAGYVLSRDILEGELGKGLSAVAAAAASQLSGERMLTVQPDDDVQETRTHRNLLRLLTEVKNASGARRIFAVDTAGRLRLDAGGGLPVGTEMPELARDRLELTRVFQGERVASQVLFTDTEGLPYKTGYAPVWHDGKVVGAVGVEGTAAFFGPLQRLLQSFFVLLLGAAAVLGAVALVTARGLAAPLTRLVRAARRIGGGDLETPVRPEPVREVGLLAQGLESMRRALESRDRQLKMMLAGVAHEVKNPIGGIELFAGLLAEELSAPTPGEDARAHIARIQREIDYLKRIVEDFLAFAREQRLNRGPVDARGLAQTAVELLRTDAEKKQVQLTLRAEEAALDADESLLTAAVVNLVKNAVQAAPEGSEVAVCGLARGSDYVLEVSDAGAGIPADAQERVFEPFFTTREKGTGLGLPLARKIVEAHGGTLTVTSSPGKTCFQLCAPLIPQAPQTD